MSEKLNEPILALVASELTAYHKNQIHTVLTLLADGNTVPFIARYRKEMTGTLDEVQIREIEDRYHYLENLEKRKQEVIKTITEQSKMTPELQAKILKATKMQQVEDLYRPYKQKRRTKATIAKEKGLEPFANYLLTFPKVASLTAEASRYLDAEKEVTSVEEVLAGAHEILAERVSDDANYRTRFRNFMVQNGIFHSEVKDKTLDEKSVYELYYDFSQPVNKIVAHRILAANRGEKEGVLKVAIELDESKIFGYLKRQLIKDETSPSAALVEAAYEDSYKRFIGPALEREIRNQLTEAADTQAIAIFGENLHNLLLQSPLKGKVVMGFDPAYRTGCKLAIVDATGKVLAIDVIYPHKPASPDKRAAAGPQFRALIEKYQVEMVAIGNGTASRESELFVAEQLKQVQKPTFYVIVSEAGASVYSASDVAREEFPDLHVEQRSAVSIARRLQDPLAELVKVEPKAIGVGQYQHDVSQKQLNSELDIVVQTAVNQVGVNLNTASAQLLQYVSGLNKTTATNIVRFRDDFGAFNARNQLKKVPRLGPKAYEQAVGFLRIPNGKNILDNTGIHPESYPIAKEVLKIAEIPERSLGTAASQQTLQQLNVALVAEKTTAGAETAKDIIQALAQPGRDLRDNMPAPLLRQDVLKMTDLKAGMELQGTVRNVIDFGAFVDIGVKQDGLVHISRLSDKFVKHPTDVVAVGDVVTVWVIGIDEKKGRIQLSMVAPKNND
jgi:uncharacterized protein